MELEQPAPAVTRAQDGGTTSHLRARGPAPADRALSVDVAALLDERVAAARAQEQALRAAIEQTRDARLLTFTDDEHDPEGSTASLDQVRDSALLTRVEQHPDRAGGRPGTPRRRHVRHLRTLRPAHRAGAAPRAARGADLRALRLPDEQVIRRRVHGGR